MAQQGFSGILFAGQGAEGGRLVMREDAMKWTHPKIGSVKTINKADIASAEWMQVGTTCQLRLGLKGGAEVRLDAFLPRDHEAVSGFFAKKYGRTLDVVEHACAGGSWGDMEVKEHTLAFRVEGKPLLELPLADVSQCANPGTKGDEVEMQFEVDDTMAPDEESVMQISFYVPPTYEGAPEAVGATTAATAFQTAITHNTGIGSVSADLVCSFDASLLAPRGTFTVELYSKFLRFSGKTYTHKISYKSISRLALLTRSETESGKEPLVISLNTPVHQGKQVHSHLVLSLPKRVAILNMNMEPEKLKKQFPRLEPEMTDRTHILYAKVLRAVSGKSVFIPGNFQTSKSETALRCAVKSVQGYLYPLEKSFMYIHKPTLFIRFDQVAFVTFERHDVPGSTNFDLVVHVKEPTGQAKPVAFQSILKTEFRPLVDFLRGKKLRIKGVDMSGLEGGRKAYGVGGEDEGEGGDSEDEDDDYEPAQDDDDDDEMEDVVAEDGIPASKPAAAAPASGMDEEDNEDPAGASSDDEDFGMPASKKRRGKGD